MDNQTLLIYIDGQEETIWSSSDKVLSLKLKPSRKKITIPVYDVNNTVGMDMPRHAQGKSCIHLLSSSSQHLLQIIGCYIYKQNEPVSFQGYQNDFEDIISKLDVETGTFYDFIVLRTFSMSRHVQGKLSKRIFEYITSRFINESDEGKSSPSPVPPQDKENLEAEEDMIVKVCEPSGSQEHSYQETEEEGQQDNFQVPHSWDLEIQQLAGDLTSLSRYIQSLSPEVLTKRDAENRTIFHALVCQLSSTKVKNLLSLVMCCQNSFGDTPLHLAIETQDYDIIKFILRFVQPEWLAIRNNDDLTPLDLAFEKKFWVLARVLAEHQIQAGTGCVLLQDYILRAMREQGGVDFLPHLLELRKRYFPKLDLNFSTGAGGRTPWWFLTHSNDVSVMQKALQSLEERSIDLRQLLTHTKRRTRFIEEAAVKNGVLFQKVTGGWRASGSDEVLLRTFNHSSVSTPSLFENKVLLQEKPSMPHKVPVEESHGRHLSMTSSALISSYEEQQQVNSQDMFSSLHSWDAEVQRHSSNLASLNIFIQSLPPGVLTKKDAQSRTVCHALGALCGQLSSADINYLPELISRVCLPECMIWQDASGNTPLHCMIEAQNTQNFDAVLRVIPNAAKCLVLKNEDDLTPLDLAFEKKLWVPARALAEHQIQAGTGCVLLQDYILRAMREQGGVDFLPHLLELRKRYFPKLDLNFSTGAGGRTPWWYLANSNDVSVMVRALQTLKEHSVDLMQLLTHTERKTRLVEEAADKNRLLLTTIQKVAGWHHSSEVDKDMADKDETSLYSDEAPSQTSSRSSVSISSSFEDLVSIQSEPGYGIPSTVSVARTQAQTTTSDNSDGEQQLKCKKKKNEAQSQTSNFSPPSSFKDLCQFKVNLVNHTKSLAENQSHHMSSNK